MSAKTTLQIIVPNSFTKMHERILTMYLSDDQKLDIASRQRLYEGIDILGQAAVESDTISSTFRQIYDKYIDQSLANPYLEQLLNLGDIASQSPALTAEFARQIAPILEDANLLSQEIPQSYFLFAYCVYWWQSFARGYAFEIEIVRDLEASEVEFSTHDLLAGNERYSPADVIVLDLLGDIKTSTYFLHIQPSGPLANDFYITRLFDRGRIRTLVVFQKPVAWQRIDGGKTVPGDLNNVLDLFPRPVQLEQAGTTLIVVEYEDWKRMVRRVQISERS